MLAARSAVDRCPKKWYKVAHSNLNHPENAVMHAYRTGRMPPTHKCRMRIENSSETVERRWNVAVYQSLLAPWSLTPFNYLMKDFDKNGRKQSDGKNRCVSEPTLQLLAASTSSWR